MKIILFIIICFTLLLTPLLGSNEVYAQVNCSTLKGKPGPHVSGTYTGDSCDTLNQYNQNTSCIGTTGNRYIVTYCAGNGCFETYPEEGPNAPDLCKRPNPASQSDIGKVFGQILPPQAIQYLGFGSTGISKFLSNLVTLIYSLAAIVLILMILWGAFDWITSEGDKEKLESAKRKIINAIVGIMLFAVAFAVIQVLGTFTGFQFFGGQK